MIIICCHHHVEKVDIREVSTKQQHKITNPGRVYSTTPSGRGLLVSIL